jgi:hypothetical protein
MHGSACVLASVAQIQAIKKTDLTFFRFQETAIGNLKVLFDLRH